MKFRKIFKIKKPIMGVIHLPPLLGCKGYKRIDFVIKKALKDLKTLEKGGVDGVLIENEYDHPHTVFISEPQVACYSVVAYKIAKETKLPVGIGVLLNDYKAAFSIAKTIGAKFIRLDVFVDTVQTKWGKIKGEPERVMEFKKKVKADDTLLFTDIHVKHAQLLKMKTLEQSAKEAIAGGSDVLLITGKKTGEPPEIDKLKRAKSVSENIPVFIGSGLSFQNASELLQYADGAIVGTSLKSGEVINLKKVLELMKVVRKLRK